MASMHVAPGDADPTVEINVGVRWMDSDYEMTTDGNCKAEPRAIDLTDFLSGFNIYLHRCLTRMSKQFTPNPSPP